MRYGQLAADFDRFAEGQNIPVALTPDAKEKHAFLARIDPVNLGIWTLCSIDPSPALRVFGVFAQKDHFVCLLTTMRRDLDGSNGRKWAAAREEALARWNIMTNYRKPVNGEQIEDDISTATTAV